MMERVNDPMDFAVSPGSPLAGDDRASDPYQVSHAVQMCIVAGVDHLHAMKSLLLDLNMLHSAAPFTMVRGALEVLSSAFWILHPAKRTVRVERVLRWHAKTFTTSTPRSNHSACLTRRRRKQSMRGYGQSPVAAPFRPT